MSRHREKLFFLLNPTHSQRDSREIYFFKPSAQNSGLCTHKEKATHMRKYANRVCTCVCVSRHKARDVLFYWTPKSLKGSRENYFFEPSAQNSGSREICFETLYLKTQVCSLFTESNSERSERDAKKTQCPWPNKDLQSITQYPLWEMPSVSLANWTSHLSHTAMRVKSVTNSISKTQSG